MNVLYEVLILAIGLIIGMFVMWQILETRPPKRFDIPKMDNPPPPPATPKKQSVLHWSDKYRHLFDNLKEKESFCNYLSASIQIDGMTGKEFMHYYFLWNRSEHKKEMDKRAFDIERKALKACGCKSVILIVNREDPTDNTLSEKDKAELVDWLAKKNIAYCSVNIDLIQEWLQSRIANRKPKKKGLKIDVSMLTGDQVKCLKSAILKDLKYYKSENIANCNG